MIDVIRLAAANRILVLCLPAYALQLLQPIDLLLFGPLKQGWIRAHAAFHHLTSTVITQHNFAKIFNIAWNSSNTPHVVSGGFRRSGIYPFNPQAFDYSKLARSNPEAGPTSSLSVTRPSVPSTSLAEPLPPSSIPCISPLLSNPQQLAGQPSSSSTSLLQPPQLFATSGQWPPSLKSLLQQPQLFLSVEQPPLPFHSYLPVWMRLHLCLILQQWTYTCPWLSHCGLHPITMISHHHWPPCTLPGIIWHHSLRHTHIWCIGVPWEARW